MYFCVQFEWTPWKRDLDRLGPCRHGGCAAQSADQSPDSRTALAILVGGRLRKELLPNEICASRAPICALFADIGISPAGPQMSSGDRAQSSIPTRTARRAARRR